MKQHLLLPLLSVALLQSLSHFNGIEKFTGASTVQLNNNIDHGLDINSLTQSSENKMSAAVFKSQEYCRAELKDFEFDAHFTIVSANVYFTGANFKEPAVAAISSNSLKPIKHLMDRCTSGTIVVFDEVEVVGPDKMIRPLQGIHLILY